MHSTTTQGTVIICERLREVAGYPASYRNYDLCKRQVRKQVKKDMTRKTQKGIAGYLQDRRLCTRNNARDELNRVAVMLARRFKSEDHRFNSDRWFRECGMRDTEITIAAIALDSSGYFTPRDEWQSLI
jgi:hypothetical protein